MGGSLLAASKALVEVGIGLDPPSIQLRNITTSTRIDVDQVNRFSALKLGQPRGCRCQKVVGREACGVASQHNKCDTLSTPRSEQLTMARRPPARIPTARYF